MRAGLAVVAMMSMGDAAFGAASGAAAPLPLVPEGSVVHAGHYTIDLGEADDPKHPRAWQGPMEIADAGGKRCTASDDVGIIEQPILLVDGHLLYVSTYSGSEATLFVVDAKDCAVKWKSPTYVGVARVTGRVLRIPGKRALRIGSNGLP